VTAPAEAFRDGVLVVADAWAWIGAELARQPGEVGCWCA
jgi:hypothetical protein